MSTDAYASLFRGTKIFFEITPCIVELKRFDSKTGQEMILKEESFNIVANRNDVQVQLPAENESFKDETKDSWQYPESWSKERIGKRIWQWLEYHGLDGNDKIASNLIGQECLIGKTVAIASSYRNNLVEIEEELDFNFEVALKNKIENIFQATFENFRSTLYLTAKLE